MKNLKKLVIAIAVLALVASCAVITAFSASVAEQELERAQAYYELAVNQKTPNMKTQNLERLYKFVAESSTLNDTSEDFLKFREKYMKFSVEVGEEYYALAMSSADINGGLSAINKIVSHFKKCPVDENVKGTITVDGEEVGVYQRHLDLLAGAKAQNDILLRKLLDAAYAEEEFSLANQHLSAIKSQIALVAPDETRWDYAIFVTRYNALYIEEAVRLAESASKVLNSTRESAENTFRKTALEIVLRKTDVKTELEAIEKAKTDAYNAAFDSFEYDADAVEADAVKAYEAAKAAKYDELVLLYGSLADGEYLKTYYETYNAKLTEGALLADAEKEAKTAARSKYNAAINALKAKLADLTAGTDEYKNAAFADIAKLAVDAGLYANAAEVVDWLCSIIEAAAEKEGVNAKNAYIAQKEAERVAAATKAGEEAYEVAFFSYIPEEERVAVYKAVYAAAQQSKTDEIFDLVFNVEYKQVGELENQSEYDLAFATAYNAAYDLAYKEAYDTVYNQEYKTAYDAEIAKGTAVADAEAAAKKAVDDKIDNIKSAAENTAKLKVEDCLAAATQAVCEKAVAAGLTEDVAAATAAYAKENFLASNTARDLALKAEKAAAGLNIYVDDSAKTTLSDALTTYENHLKDTGVEVNLGSFADEFSVIDGLLNAVSLDNAKFLFAEYDKIIANPSDYKYPLNSKGNAIYGAYNFMAENNLSGVPGYNEFYARVNDAKSKYDKELVAAKEALDRQGALDQHDWNTKAYHNYFKDFEDGKVINAYNPTSTSKSSLGEDTVGGKPNKYLQMNYGETKTHLYFEPSFAINEYGIVGDFDVKISSDFNCFQFQAMLKGVLCTAEIFQIVSSQTDGKYDHKSFGVKYLADDKNNFVEVQGLFTPDVWSHISFTYDPSNYSGKLYVNYEYIGDICYHDHDYQGSGQYVTMQRMRLGVSTTFQTFSLDNLHFFSGTTYRDYHKFDAANMSEGDKFKYYVGMLVDDSISPSNRNAAYVKAKAVYENYVDNPAFAEYTKYFTEEEYEDYYANEIKAPAILGNLAAIKEKVEYIKSIELSSETTGMATSAIKELRNFISANVDFIDRTNAEYLTAMAEVDKVDSNIIRFSQVKEFTDAVNRFSRATTLGAMKKHFETAKQLYNLAGYGKEALPGEKSNIEYVINDPVIKAFKEKHDDVDPFEYYVNELANFENDKVGDSDMEKREKIENSKKVIDALSFITSMEGYEDTEEFWSANYDYISQFVTIIRKIVSTGNYELDPPDMKSNPTVRFTAAEIKAAVEHFEIIDTYFYELIQNEHIKVITAQLESFKTSATYIEKVGICSYINNYIADNDDSIDYDREEIIDLIYTLDVYSRELELQEEDYASLLEENTQYFIATIAEMQSVITYKELKPLYEKATTYYYGMNVNTTEAKEAVKLYDEYGVKLAFIEESSKFFIEYVSTLKMADKLSGIRKQDAIYEALVNAMNYVDGIDTTYTGVESAYTTYVKTLNEYNTGASSVNSEINVTLDAMSAVRADSISSTVLATVKNIIAK